MNEDETAAQRRLCITEWLNAVNIALNCVSKTEINGKKDYEKVTAYSLIIPKQETVFFTVFRAQAIINIAR